ncbi:MAG: signal peptidase I [Mycobacteriales bacterium]
MEAADEPDSAAEPVTEPESTSAADATAANPTSTPRPPNPLAAPPPADRPRPPTEPTNTTEPTGPANPLDPTAPAEPADPAEPTAPTNPLDRTASAEAAEPAGPAEATEPAEPLSPTASAEPAEPTEPLSPTASAQATEPVAPAEPAEPTEPLSPIGSAEAAEPAGRAEPTGLADPLGSTIPPTSAAGSSTESAASSAAAGPVGPTQPTRPTGPLGESTDATEAVGTANSAGSVAPFGSAEQPAGAADPAGSTATPAAAEGAGPPPSTQADRVADGEPDEPDRPSKAPARKRSFWKELPILLAAAIVLAIVIKTFLVQAFFIPSSSMEKTLHGCPGCSGDRVLVNKLVYRFRNVHRGDIIVFKGTGRWEENQEYQFSKPSNPIGRTLHWVSGSLGLGVSGETDYIKRVIAVGGDTVTCCDSQGRVTVNGYPLNEPYVFEPASMQPGACVSRPFAPVTVPKGQLWVMGDHRSDSSDSRCKGPIREKDVIGKAFITIWPPSRWRTLGTPGTFHQVPRPDNQGLPAMPTGPDPVTVAGLALTPWLYRRTRRRTARHRDAPS